MGMEEAITICCLSVDEDTLRNNLDDEMVVASIWGQSMELDVCVGDENGASRMLGNRNRPRVEFRARRCYGHGANVQNGLPWTTGIVLGVSQITATQSRKVVGVVWKTKTAD